MSTLMSIPTSITPEADEHIERLGMRSEFEQMLEYIRGHFAGLRRIEVTLEPPYDTGGDDCVSILAFRDPEMDMIDDPEWPAWRKWTVTTFPPEVFIHFYLMLVGDDGHGR